MGDITCPKHNWVLKKVKLEVLFYFLKSSRMARLLQKSNIFRGANMKQQWGDTDKYTPVAVKTKYHLTKTGP